MADSVIRAHFCLFPVFYSKFTFSLFYVSGAVVHNRQHNDFEFLMFVIMIQSVIGQTE